VSATTVAATKVVRTTANRSGASDRESDQAFRVALSLAASLRPDSCSRSGPNHRRAVPCGDRSATGTAGEYGHAGRQWQDF